VTHRISSGKKLIAATITAATITAGIPAANAAPPQATATAPTFPTFVHLPADQAAHPSATREWWYIVGHLSAHGHKYGYQVNLASSGRTQIAITDITAGKYYSQQVLHPPGDYSASPTVLDVRMPTATLSGPMNAMHVTANMPAGRLDLTLDAQGPAMYGNGTGLFPFLGGSSYYYSLPKMRTSGTLTLNGRTSEVTGESWLDRQWGEWDWSRLNKWTWMAIQLRNGDTINLWDLLEKQGEQAWATVLHPDGSESVVSVDPLAKDAANFETSPTTGQRYAGKWKVKIPSLRLELVVTASPVLQEIQAGDPLTPGLNEAAASVTGTYQGKAITGKAYVEQFGIWK
jgi:predicted secreted hydrolase